MNYFSPPVHQQQDVEEEVPISREEMLEENMEHFLTTGRARYSELTKSYPNAIDPVRWSRLTTIHGSAKNRKKRAQKAKNQNPGSIHLLVTELLSNFVAYGFAYHIMQGTELGLLDKKYGEEANGNCIAYARAFADIINSFGIDAEAKWVREEHGGRFIVKLSNFIDSRVKGHIFEDDVLHAGYYVFTSHAATWVPATQRYYDPMATIYYTSLDPYVECELDSAEKDTVFTPTTKPKTLCTNYDWKLVRTEEEVAGGFYKLDLVEIED